MLSVLTVTVLLCGICLGLVRSTESILAILIFLFGSFILFPLAVIVSILSIMFSALGSIMPISVDLGIFLSDFVDGKYGIPGWYFMAVAVPLWFITIFQFADGGTKSASRSDSSTGEIQELTDISGVGPQVADQLQEAGFNTVDDLETASKSTLTESDGIGNTLAHRIKSQVGETNDNRRDDTNEGKDEPLTSISGVDTTWADALKKAGYGTVNDVRAASKSDLSGTVGSTLAARIKADVGDLEIDEETASNESNEDSTEDTGWSDGDGSESNSVEAPDVSLRITSEQATTNDQQSADSFDDGVTSDGTNSNSQSRETTETESEYDTPSHLVPDSNQNQSTNSATQQGIIKGDASNNRLETLQQSAESHVDTATTDPFDNPAATQYHLERAHSEYSRLAERAKKQDVDNVQASAREESKTIKTRLDALTTITDSLETARESVPIDQESATLSACAKTDLETAREAYETAIDAAEEADFDIDEFEREYEAVVTELEQRRRDTLTAAIEEVGAELGHIPTLAEVVARRDVEEAAYHETFETWEAAIEASNIDREVAIIEDLRAVADRTDGALDQATYRRDGQHDLSRVRSTFDSWSDALNCAFDEANVTSDEDGTPIVVTEPTRDDYIAAICRVADASDRVVKSTDVRDQSPYSVNEIVHEFGSWQNALEAADVDNELRLLRELQRVANEVGHRPSTTEMNQYGHVSATMYANYFGTYTSAVDEVYGSDDDSGSTTNKNDSDVESNESDENTDSDEDIERVNNDDKPTFATIDGITEDGRLRRPLAVKVTKISDDPGTRKQARLLVEDLERTQCWLNVWQKHDITVSWELGHWYVLEQARGKYWSDGRGEPGRELSSTADLRVDHVGTDQPSGTVHDTETIGTDSDSKQGESEPDQPAEETTDDGTGEPDDTAESEDILADLIDEFDDIAPGSP